MKMSQPLISIVIPVYNIENCISQCLESLVNQTYKNLEIICVNDGSTDGSLAILQSYAEKDERVIVIDKKNEGVSRARNDALKRATGDYLLFVDSDDWIDLDTCETVVSKTQENDVDVVIFGYMREYENASKPSSIFDGDRTFDEQQCNDELFRRILGLTGEALKHPERGDSLSSVWGRLYKRSLISDNNLQFEDLSVIGTNEDGLMNLQIFYNVKSAVYIDKPFYHYRKNIGATVATKYKEKLFSQWQILIEQMQKFIDDHDCDETCKQALSNRRALSIIGLGFNVSRSKKGFFGKVKELRYILKDERYRRAYKELPFNYFPIYWKLYFGLAKRRFAMALLILINVMTFIKER